MFGNLKAKLALPSNYQNFLHKIRRRTLLPPGHTRCISGSPKNKILIAISAGLRVGSYKNIDYTSPLPLSSPSKSWIFTSNEKDCRSFFKFAKLPFKLSPSQDSRVLVSSTVSYIVRNCELIQITHFWHLSYLSRQMYWAWCHPSTELILTFVDILVDRRTQCQWFRPCVLVIGLLHVNLNPKIFLKKSDRWLWCLQIFCELVWRKPKKKESYPKMVIRWCTGTPTSPPIVFFLYVPPVIAIKYSQYHRWTLVNSILIKTRLSTTVCRNLSERIC